MELVIAVAISFFWSVPLFFNQSYIYCNTLISYWPMQVLWLPEQNHFWDTFLHNCYSMGDKQKQQKSEKSGLVYFCKTNVTEEHCD